MGTKFLFSLHTCINLGNALTTIMHQYFAIFKTCKIFGIHFPSSKFAYLEAIKILSAYVCLLGGGGGASSSPFAIPENTRTENSTCTYQFFVYG